MSEYKPCRSASSSSVKITAPFVEFSKGTTPRAEFPDWTALNISVLLSEAGSKDAVSNYH